MKSTLFSIFLFTMFIMMSVAVTAQNNTNDNRTINSQKEVAVSLYPMPTEGLLHISFNRSITETPTILVYDMIGNLLENVQIDREAVSTFTINLTGKKAGFYFIKVQTDTESFSRRITVKS